MTSPFEISDVFTEAWAGLMPIEATTFGIAGHDDECTDFSPEGFEERNELYRTTRGQLSPSLDHPDPDQSFAARVLTGWLDEQIDQFDRGKWRRDLNHIASPFQHMRDVFDLMPRESVEDWETITARLDGLGGMLEGYRRCLQTGLESGDVVALRQVDSLADQVEVAASDRSPFVSFPATAQAAGADSEGVGRAVEQARSACAGFATWLRDEYQPRASASDSVGRERYLEGVDEFLGMTIDPEETYDWGWSEVRRLREEMEKTSAEIDAGKTIAEVIEMLDTDPARAAATRQDFVDFVSAIQDQAIAQLSGEHFDVPE
ncbi:MAG: DUF885 domain-containing protein, partial [Acidimicrobiia bacterium]